MITDTEIKLRGIQLLAEHLGDVENGLLPLFRVFRESLLIIQSGDKTWMKIYP